MDRRHHPSLRSRGELLEAVRDARFSQGITCPRCDAREVQRWGSFSGRQRYRCLGCRRTFSDLSGTPAMYLKKVELLPAYTGCLAETLTVREAAAKLGVHPSTAFRWRHRLLAALGRTETSRLSGWIEVDSWWFPHSRKGERLSERPARSRGPRYRYLYEGHRATVLAACDRLGHVATHVTDVPEDVTSISPGDIAQLLAGRVQGQPVLTSQAGPLGAVGRLAHRNGWGFAQGAGSVYGLRSGPAHVRTVRGYLFRFRRWLPRFRGVATHYLPNYLSWHQLLDAPHRHGPEATVLRWPLASGFG